MLTPGQENYDQPQFSSVQSVSRIWPFATPWITACQASPSITNSWSLPQPTSIEPVMPSSHLILCRPLLLLPPIPPCIRVFSNESTLRIALTMINLDSILKSRDITLLKKVRLVKVMVFPVAIYGGESWTTKKAWTPKNWCFWIVALEKTHESPLDSKEIQPVHPKGNQSWLFIGRTDAEAETPIFWLPDAKNWLIRKGPDAGKDWRQEEKGMTEDEIVGWHHQLDGHGIGDGQGSLAYCSPWGLK